MCCVILCVCVCVFRGKSPNLMLDAFNVFRFRFAYLFSKSGSIAIQNEMRKRNVMV